ncbi:hypothetical protein [Microbulbifer sp. ZKSA002]|uniref:hypothetical protein n=1 Tax=Microbulbifer sp. ZKSA002 TaxID=3243388 RepID=UPI004039FC29
MWGELHEVKKIVVKLPESIEAGKGNRLLRELGATLHYDVYSFEANSSEIWQSDSVLYLHLFKEGSEVDAQDNFDEIHIFYPLATRPSSDQLLALELSSNIISKFGGSASYQDQSFSVQGVQAEWDKCNSFLLKEWGEEPGSHSLRRMIEENHA